VVFLTNFYLEGVLRVRISSIIVVTSEICESSKKIETWLIDIN